MLGAPYSSSHPVCEIPEMIQASSQTGSTMMNNYKESSFYVVPSVAGLQYGATTLQDLDSTARNNSLPTGGHGLLGEVVTTSMPLQLHHMHASPLATPGSRTHLNLDVIDNLLTFSDGVALYGSIFQVDNNIPRTPAAAQGPSGHISDGTTSNSDELSHSVELPRSPVTACTSLLSTLALRSGTTGGSDQSLSTSSVSMEAWNAPTAFSCPPTATPPIIPVFHGPSVGGLGKTNCNNLSVVGLNMPVGSLQALPDLQQADYKLASRQFLSLPALPSVNNIQAMAQRRIQNFLQGSECGQLASTHETFEAEEFEVTNGACHWDQWCRSFGEGRLQTTASQSRGLFQRIFSNDHRQPTYLASLG